MSFVRDLDAPLLQLSPKDAFTLRDACAGVHAFGQIGGGKTSGAQVLAGAYLRAGFGGLVTVSKPEDVPLWRAYCAKHSRESSLILFDENEGFNFLNYELSRQGVDGIGTVTECLMRIIEAAKKTNPTATHRSGEAFWDNSARQILRYTILPLYSAQGTLSIADIIHFLATAPQSSQDVADPKWQKSSFMFEVMDAARRFPRIPVSAQVLNSNLDFWTQEFPAIPDKTRGNILITVSATLDRFKHGRLQRAFCGRTTVVPEMSFHGAVIVLAMPTLTWNEDGVIAQTLFKYLWMRSVLARNSLEQKHRERPVFLWSDEAQETVSSYDFEFQSLCRSSLCCTTYLTQSLPTYYAKIGGDNPKDAANALVGKFATHIYFANSCADTNEYAARTIGKVMKRHESYNAGTSRNVNFGMSEGENESRGSNSSYSFSSSRSHAQTGRNTTAGWSAGNNSGAGNNWGSNRGRSTGDSESRGYSESMEYEIEPGDFAKRLKTGGTPNKNLVTAIWFQSGRTLKATGKNIMEVTFRQ